MVAAIGTLYDLLLSYDGKMARLLRDRQYIPSRLSELIHAFAGVLGLAPLDSLDLPAVAARIKDKRPTGWTDKQWKLAFASVLRRSVSRS